MPARLPAAVRQLVVLAAVAGLTGCGHRPVRRVVRFAPEPGTPAVQEEAPRDGIYRVKYATTPGARRKDLRRVDDAWLWVRKGERVGFYSEKDGTVMAFAAGRVFPVEKLPADATFCLWTYRAAPVRWDLGKDLAEAFRGLGTVVALVGVVALAARGWYYELTHPDDDCAWEDGY